MMAIPRAFLQIGWLPGSCMLVGVAALTFFTLSVLVQGSAATQASTYGELVTQTCGAGLMRLLQLAVVLFCFGFSVVYLVRAESAQCHAKNRALHVHGHKQGAAMLCKGHGSMLRCVGQQGICREKRSRGVSH